MNTHSISLLRRIFLLGLLGLIVGVTASAQGFFLRVGGGLATHSGSDPSRVVGAITGGLGYEYEFNQHLTIAPTLSMYSKGWKDDDVQTPVIDDKTGEVRLDDFGNPVMSTANVAATANYLHFALPLRYYFRLGEGRYIYIGMGPYAALGVTGKLKVKGDGSAYEAAKYYYDAHTFGRDAQSRRFDAGLQAAVGYQLVSGLRIGLEADFGLTNCNNASAVTLQGVPRHPARNVSGLLTLTYHFGKNDADATFGQ